MLEKTDFDSGKLKLRPTNTGSRMEMQRHREVGDAGLGTLLFYSVTCF